MKLSVVQKLDDLQKQLMGYIGLMSYRYCQMCVKAEPAALLSIEETISGQSYMMEDMAEVYPHENEQENQIMDLFPKRSEYIPFIIKGVMTEHPEFKVSQEKYKRYDDDPDKDDSDENKYVRLVMPDVDKDRKDVIMNYVDVQYNICKVNMSKAEAKTTAEITVACNGDANAIKEAKDKIKEMADEMDKMRDDLTNDKKKEVNEAYERYLKNGGGAGSSNNNNQTQSGIGQSLKMD